MGYLRWGAGLVCKRSAIHVSSPQAYIMHGVLGVGCVYVGCPCILWDGQEVGGCPGDARARSTGAWPMVA